MKILLIFVLGATVGMRTMLDAFVPAIAALHAGHSVKEAAQQAEAGADATKSMNSLAGRSNYINQDILSGTPDPGAVAVACAFATAAEVIAFLKGECIVC